MACGAGLPCAQAADQNYFCDFTALGAVRANATSSGTCGACPQGFASDGMFCYACPSLSGVLLSCEAVVYDTPQSEYISLAKWASVISL